MKGFTQKNDAWLMLWDHTGAIFLPEGISNHSPAVIKFYEATHIKGALFGYYEMWRSCPEFETHLLNAWNKTADGDIIFQLVNILQVLKGSLKKMHRSQFSNAH